MRGRALLLVGLVGSLGGTAAAELKLDVVKQRLPAVVRTAPGAPLAGLTLFLNKCTNGCNVRPGGNDATTDSSDIAGQAAVLSEHAWLAGEWEGVVQCVKEVYSPFNIKVVDQRPGPADGVYNEVIVAGSAEAIGYPGGGACGVGEFSVTACAPTTNAVAFTFTEGGCHEAFASEDPDPGGAATGIFGTCWVIAQETAHSFALDHEFQYQSTKMSACNDPMTYRSDCGGQKFFRNDYATCGEFTQSSVHNCGGVCGDTQNSHGRLLSILGPGTPITRPPTVAFNAPAEGVSVMKGTAFIGTASAQRGVARVELWLNGYKWGQTLGVAFGKQGQPAAAYTLLLPDGVPDSKYDVVLKAFDDIDVEGETTALHVVKGKATGCDASVTNADGTIDTCLAGQMCTDGKCAWTDAGTGAFGDACTYPQFCVSGYCDGTSSGEICTHDCDPSISDSCPMGYTCAASNLGTACLAGAAASGGGCCSTGSDGVGAALMSLSTLALLFGRRRKR